MKVGFRHYSLRPTVKNMVPQVIYTFFILSQPLFVYGGCPKLLSVNITDGEVNRTSRTITKFDLNFREDHYFRENGDIYGCVCDIVRCVRKCCPADKSLFGQECVLSTDEPTFEYYDQMLLTNLSTTDFFLIYGKTCESSEFFAVGLEDEFFLQTDGSLYGMDLMGVEFRMYSPLEYCVDNVLDEEEVDTRRLQAFVCAKDTSSETRDAVNEYGKVKVISISD